jgi:carbon-monoxide dehydrogenase medium subunit
MYETALEPGEILVDVKIPFMPERSEAVYLKYSALSANDWPCLGVAALLSKDNGRCEALKLALGGMAATPLSIDGLEFAQGQSLTDPLMEKILRIVNEQISPFSDLRGSEWYKRQMARVFVNRAIRQLAGSAAR